MNKALAKIDYSEIVTYKVDGERFSISFQEIKEVICRGGEFSDVEVYHFMHFCKALQANPFIGEAYLIRYEKNKPASLVVGVGYHEKIAESYPDYDGIESGLIVRTLDNHILEVVGAFRTNDQELLGAWAQVHRKNHRIPKIIKVMFERYCKMVPEIDETGKWKKDSTGKIIKRPMALWATNPEDMILKVARAQALRQSFKRLKGAFIEAEIQPHESDIEIKPETVTLDELKKELWDDVAKISVDSQHLGDYMSALARNMQKTEEEVYTTALHEIEHRGEPYLKEFCKKLEGWRRRTFPSEILGSQKKQVKSDTAKESRSKEFDQCLKQLNEEMAQAKVKNDAELNDLIESASAGEDGFSLNLQDVRDQLGPLHVYQRTLKKLQEQPEAIAD